MLRLSNDIRSVNKRKPATEIGIVYIYQSDFSSDVDGWSSIIGVQSLTAPSSVGGENNALQAILTVAAGKATKSIFQRTIPATTIGQDYEVTLQYYIPSENDEVLYLETVQLGSTNTSVDSSAVTTNVWHSRTVTITATGTGTALRLNMNEDHEAGAQDKVAFKNITFREI